MSPFEGIAVHAERELGCDLISMRQVGLPIFRVVLRALTVARKQLPTLFEFVLRSLDEGLVNPDEVAGFLGLGQKVADRTILALRDLDYLRITTLPGERTNQLVLTSQGRTALRKLELSPAEEVQATLYIDGLTRKLVRKGTDFPRRVVEAGRVELPAMPQGRLDRDELFEPLREHLSRQAGASGVRDRELIDILDVQRVETLFRDDALALVFRERQQGECQVSLLVSGAPSPEHEAVLRRHGRSTGRALFAAGSTDCRDLFRKLFGPAIADGAVLAEETAPIRAEIRSLDEAAKSGSDAAGPATGASDEPGEPTPCLAERLAALKAELYAIPVRYLEVYELPAHLREALETARQRVIIKCGGIQGAVIDEDFLDALKGALARGVDVLIGYGRPPHGLPPSDKVAFEAFRSMAAEYPRLQVKALEDEDELYALVCDDRFVVATAFDWLAHWREPRRSLRDERGLCVRIPEWVDAAVSSLASRFATGAEISEPDWEDDFANADK